MEKFVLIKISAFPDIGSEKFVIDLKRG